MTSPRRSASSQPSQARGRSSDRAHRVTKAVTRGSSASTAGRGIPEEANVPPSHGGASSSGKGKGKRPARFSASQPASSAVKKRGTIGLAKTRRSKVRNCLFFFPSFSSLAAGLVMLLSPWTRAPSNGARVYRYLFCRVRVVRPPPLPCFCLVVFSFILFHRFANGVFVCGPFFVKVG